MGEHKNVNDDEWDKMQKIFSKLFVEKYFNKLIDWKMTVIKNKRITVYVKQKIKYLIIHRTNKKLKTFC